MDWMQFLDHYGQQAFVLFCLAVVVVAAWVEIGRPVRDAWLKRIGATFDKVEATLVKVDQAFDAQKAHNEHVTQVLRTENEAHRRQNDLLERVVEQCMRMEQHILGYRPQRRLPPRTEAEELLPRSPPSGGS